MHGIMGARENPQFSTVVETTDLFVPDGFSVIWLAREMSYLLKRRASGWDLIWPSANSPQRKGYRCFFYGYSDDTLAVLTARLEFAFSELQIAGFHPHPES